MKWTAVLVDVKMVILDNGSIGLVLQFGHMPSDCYSNFVFVKLGKTENIENQIMYLVD